MTFPALLSKSAHIIVGMSGGVDSSVTALLLKQQGYQVEGLFMKNWEEDDNTDLCTAKQDYLDALAVSDKIGIPLRIANFSSEYWDHVFEDFIQEYKRGNTPNPDVLCNKEIKFKAFLNYAKTLGADYIATGHYVKKQIMTLQGRSPYPSLFKGADPKKDQSYFLYAIQESQLEQSLFPLGDLTKPEVRKIAHDFGLITSQKKDSTGICFIGKRPFRDFLKRYLSPKPGSIQSTDGQVLGQHEGLMYHTLGQRKGLQIGGVQGAMDSPWYVVEKQMKTNTLIVAQGKDHDSLYSKALRVSNIHWINQSPWPAGQPLYAKIRYRQTDQRCQIHYASHQTLILFDRPQRAVTPGQSIVFYDNDCCLGGAIIEDIVRSI